MRSEVSLRMSKWADMLLSFWGNLIPWHGTSESRTLYHTVNVQGKTNDEVWNSNKLTLHWTNTNLVRWWRYIRPAKSSEDRSLILWWGLYRSVHIFFHGSEWYSIVNRFSSLCDRPFLKHQELHKHGSLQNWMSIHPTSPRPHLPHPHPTKQAHECQCTWHGLSGWQTRSMTLPLQTQRSITRMYGNQAQNLTSQNVS